MDSSVGNSNTMHFQNGISGHEEDRINTTDHISSSDVQQQQQQQRQRQNELYSSSDSADDLNEIDWNTATAATTTTTAELPSTKPKPESQEVDERDRYSPLRYPLSLPLQSLNDDFNSVLVTDCESIAPVPAARRSLDSCRVSSKEEKQRQNEEKKTPASTSNNDAPLSVFGGIDSSSVSSETVGSWESIYPPARKTKTMAYTEKPENEPQKSHASGSEMNCFIDASTLLDDGEISYTTNMAYESNASNDNFSNATASRLESNSGSGNSGGQIKSTTTYGSKHNSFETNDDHIDINTQHSTYGDNIELKKSKENLNEEEFDRDEAEALVINLSDEQKLSTQKSFEAMHHRPDIKDQYSSECISTNGPKPVSLNMLGDYGSRGDCAKIGGGGDTRQENERKQGHFLFSNSIQQFSGHAMSPKIPYLEENQSDFSLPSIYSGGSDCASTFDTSSHISSDRDSHDFGELTNFSIGHTSSKGDSVIYPDTPHNSILQVNLSRNSLGPSDSAIASLSSSESNAISIPSRRSHDDTVPILSGGASVKDFTPKQCESPLMQRKTENCPIISVGMSALDFETKPKPRERISSLAMNSWVVDMSDCGKKNRRRGSESSSLSIDSKPDRSSSNSSTKGFGYYVSLNDMKPAYPNDEHLSKSLNYHSSSSSCASAEPRKKSTGFFVDFSNNGSHATNTPPPSSNDNSEQVQKSDDKKNIFSMFIDFGNDDTSQQRNTPKHRDSTAKPTYNNNVKGNDTNSTESPVLNRRNQSYGSQQSSSDSENKRHSWNASKESPQLTHVREHKRSVSTSSDKGIMNILDKIPLISKTSSMSIDTPNSPHDDITSKSLSSYSNNSLTSLSVQSSGSKFMEQDEKGTGRRHQKDARINETFDKSSQGSLTDDILSKNSSPASHTDTDDATFHNDNDDTLHGDISGSHLMMETIPETKEAVVLRRPQQLNSTNINNNNNNSSNNNNNNNKFERHTMETLHATIEKQKQLLNTVSEEVSSFVKLSDMDKPAAKFELHNSESRPKSVGSRIGKLFDNRAGNRNTWHHMSKSTGNNLSNLASSAENFKSLTRIFPHLGKDLSNSLPTNFDQSTSNTSPNEYTMDMFQSDFSTSSATSSISRSGIDSAEEFSLSAAQPRRLGEDLLKMFLQEIATDVVIEVNGRRMRAHKCILRSRCQYFAAILAGGWVESAGNVISLSGYSYGSVHFALCHIYSGASHVPDGISLTELAGLADLLGLEGLKEVAAHSIKTTYCHSFHKPCGTCIDGVMQVFPLALNQGLDDLYRKCLRWSCKYYLKVWPSRPFSLLPSELVTRCKQHIIAHMSSETVIYTLLDCDHLLALLAPCRWASGVEINVRDIIDAGHVYVTEHYASLIASDGFLSLGQGQSWNISRLENMLLRAGSSLTPDQACRSYQRITRLDSVLIAKVNKLHTSRIDKSIFMSDYDTEIDVEDEEELDWNPDFIRLVTEMLAAVEQCLVRQCARAMKCSQWQRMDAELQKKVQKLACLTEPVERRIVRPKTISSASCMPNNRAHDLYQVKMAIQAHTKRSQEGHTSIRTTHVQQQAVNTDTKAASGPGKVTKSTSRAQVPDLISTIKQPKSNVQTKSESKTSVTAYRRSASESSKRRIPLEKSSSSIDANTRKSNYNDVKSRYMEPPKRQANNKDTLKVRACSSSGSSRTSSPMISSLIKDGNTNHGNNKKMTDSTTMSRDSLASPAKKSDKLHSNRGQASQHEQQQQQQIDHERLSADSLGGSLHSSVITNKTKSQESLVKADSRGRPPPLPDSKSNNAENVKSKQLHSKNATGVVGKNAQLKVCSTLLSQTSSTVNSSTPSSMTVKSYLSSSNSINSPRDAVVNRFTTPANQIPLKRTAEPKPPVKSFLSARSRQILAQKKSLSHSDSSKSVPAVIKETTSVPNAVNKSSSTSNILNQKTKNFPTTLHLRRSAKLSTGQQQPLSLPPSSTGKTPVRSTPNPSLMNPTKSSSMKMATPNNKVGRDVRSVKDRKHSAVNSAGENRLNRCNNDYDDDVNETMPGQRVESKLERSSTFCKERSDINTNELEVID